MARERARGDTPEGDLDVIQDAREGIMYPEQFAPPWERALYEALQELVADLDLKNFPRPHIEKLLRDFGREQERRQEACRLMEAFSRSKK